MLDTIGSRKGELATLHRLRAYQPSIQNFSACWSTPEFQTDLNGYVTLDGFSVGATSSPKGCKKERIKSSFYPSSTTICNFSFSAITLTGSSFSHIYPLCHLTLVIQTMMRTSILRSLILERSKLRFGPVRYRRELRPTKLSRFLPLI